MLAAPAADHADSGHRERAQLAPGVQFFPAMRFDPTKSVQLFMYAQKVSRQDARNWLMFYCPDKGKCIDESVTDSDLSEYARRPATAGRL